MEFLKKIFFITIVMGMGLVPVFGMVPDDDCQILEDSSNAAAGPKPFVLNEDWLNNSKQDQTGFHMNHPRAQISAQPVVNQVVNHQLPQRKKVLCAACTGKFDQNNYLEDSSAKNGWRHAGCRISVSRKTADRIEEAIAVEQLVAIGGDPEEKPSDNCAVTYGKSALGYCVTVGGISWKIIKLPAQAFDAVVGLLPTSVELALKAGLVLPIAMLPHYLNIATGYCYAIPTNVCHSKFNMSVIQSIYCVYALGALVTSAVNSGKKCYKDWQEGMSEAEYNAGNKELATLEKQIKLKDLPKKLEDMKNALNELNKKAQ